MMTSGNCGENQRTKYSLDAFAEACGGPSPLALECEHYGKSPLRRRIFAQPFVVIGSGARTDLCLTHDGVAPRHAYLQVIGHRVFAIDLKSKVGILWEGETEAKRCGWVRPGRGLRIGPYQIGVSGQWQEQAKASPSFGTDDPLAAGSYRGLGLDFPKLTLELVDGPPEAVGAKCRINRLLSLAGHSRTCQIMLRAKGVWPCHAAFLMTPRGVWMIDLVGYVAGVTINGAHARWARIDEGDEVKIGELRWVARYREASSSSSVSVPAIVPEASATRSPSARFRAILEEIDQCCTNLTAPTSPPLPALSSSSSTLISASPQDKALALSDPPASPSPLESALLAQQSQFLQMFSQVQQMALVAAETIQGLQREQAQTRGEMEQMRRLAAEVRGMNLGLNPPHHSLAARNAPPSSSHLIPPSALAQPLISVPLVALESQFAPLPHANGNGNGNGHGHGGIDHHRNGDVEEADVSGDSAHIDLYQKISAIQRGRQTPLQRLINMIGGAD